MILKENFMASIKLRLINNFNLKNSLINWNLLENQRVLLVYFETEFFLFITRVKAILLCNIKNLILLEINCIM